MEGNRSYTAIDDTPLFWQFYVIAGDCWDFVATWRGLALDTVGKQLVRATDSICANLVEGDGRYRDTDALHFFTIARASARESCYWIRVAGDRNLIDQNKCKDLLRAMENASKELNAFIRYRRNNLNTAKVKESIADYAIDD